MSLPAALGAQHTDALRDASADVSPVADGARVTPDRPAGSPAVRRARRAAATGPGRRSLDLARRVARRLVLPELLAAEDRTAARIDELFRRHSQLADTHVDQLALASGLHANTANLELLKAEVRALERTLEELGMAFAPATGLAGVAARFGELREQVNALSRRLRQMDGARGGSDSGSPPASLPAPAGGGAPSALDELFDYVAFERRFRGAPEDVLATQTQRYADLLAAHEPVVDVGCGRGELAEALTGRGVRVVGVEPDAGMAAEARARGLEVHQVDAVAYLSAQPDGSLGAVFSAHVAEHVPFEALLRIVHVSLDKLRPGGVFVAETPNPASLIVPSNSFILDPTHLRPIHPSLFAFVCETAGFRDVRLSFYSPATGYHLPRSAAEGPVAAALDVHAERLNHVLFGPQEYAIVATKAGLAPTLPRRAGGRA